MHYKEEQLIKLAKKNHGILTSRGCDEIGVERRFISQLVAKGYLTKLSRGIYQLVSLPLENPFIIYQTTYRKGIYDLNAALALYGKCDITYPLEMAFPHGYNTSTVNKEAITPLCVNQLRYQYGITTVKTQHNVRIKTYRYPVLLMHCIIRKNNIDPELIRQCWLEYLSTHTLKDLNQVAFVLKCQNRYDAYIKTLVK